MTPRADHVGIPRLLGPECIDAEIRDDSAEADRRGVVAAARLQALGPQAGQSRASVEEKRPLVLVPLAERDEARIAGWREETWPVVIKRRRRTWAPG